MSESFPFLPSKHESTEGPSTSHHQGPLATPARLPNFRRNATRADLLDAVYAACPSLSRQQAREIFEMTLDEISAALVTGDSVKLRGFGLFSVREKRARVGRNPRTGQEAPITPRRVLTFKASPVLMERLNEPTDQAATAVRPATGRRV